MGSLEEGGRCNPSRSALTALKRYSDATSHIITVGYSYLDGWELH